ncbi:MAG: hypothetical protein LV480_04950 [Methylacidiphilales bacterium]|nr:hypothetical protein [Candidatus Methylacidiphilales bacterium]
MNRIQFILLTSLCGLVLLLLIGNIFLAYNANRQQALFNQAQEMVREGQVSQTLSKQLALRIYEESQKTQDQALKDLLVRQQISYTPAKQSANPTDLPVSPAPAPAH